MKRPENSTVMVGGNITPTGEIRVAPESSEAALALTTQDVEEAFQCVFCAARQLYGGGIGPVVRTDGGKCKVKCDPAVIYLNEGGNRGKLPCRDGKEIKVNIKE